MLSKRLLFVSLGLLLASTSAMGKERSCSAQLSAVVSKSESILLADITTKGQDTVATSARVEARDRAFHCFFRLLENRFSNLGVRDAAKGPQECRGSNIQDFAHSEVDVETKVRIAACTTYRHILEQGKFSVSYYITTFGDRGCGNPDSKYAIKAFQFQTPLWPKDFCQRFGFNYFLPY